MFGGQESPPYLFHMAMSFEEGQKWLEGTNHNHVQRLARHSMHEDMQSCVPSADAPTSPFKGLGYRLHSTGKPLIYDVMVPFPANFPETTSCEPCFVTWPKVGCRPKKAVSPPPASPAALPFQEDPGWGGFKGKPRRTPTFLGLALF